MTSSRQVSPWPQQKFIGLHAVMPLSYYKFSLSVCEPTLSSPPTFAFSTTTCTSWGWKTPAGTSLNTHKLIWIFPLWLYSTFDCLTSQVLTHKVWNCFSVFHVFRIATFLSHLDSINDTAQKYKNLLIRQQQKFDETEEVNQQFIISCVSITRRIALNLNSTIKSNLPPNTTLWLCKYVL